jgi:predicted PurR-regulated permease PerM
MYPTAAPRGTGGTNMPAMQQSLGIDPALATAAEKQPVHERPGITEVSAPPASRSGGDAEKLAWLERIVLILLFIGLLAGVLAVLRPFTTSILFGAALASSAWPLRQAMVRRGVGHSAAALILLVLSLALIVVPIVLIAPHLADQLEHGMRRTEAYFATTPEQPQWLTTVPLIGKQLALAWDQVVAVQGDLRAALEPYVADIRRELISVAQAMADSAVQALLSMIIATMFWINGDALIETLHQSLQRLGGAAADQTLVVAAGAIRGVVYGVVGTAVVQALVLAIGLAIAGVPGAAILGFVALLLAISQIGAPLLVLIWGGAAFWLFGQDHQLLGIFMIIWGLFVSILDNFLKPWLIGFGIAMPLSLTILGVFGGFVAFGFLGLIIGPTLIAIIFTLLQAWRSAAGSTQESQA